MSIPTFWLGSILILVFAIGLGMLPASGYVPFIEDPIANLQRMILPAVVLGLGFGAVLLRQVRSAMIRSLGSDYIRTARAKGLTERQVVIGHALRNSLITVVTILGLELGALISGSVVTESIFLIPGFGRLIIEAISRRDYPVIQGVALFSAVVYIVINLGGRRPVHVPEPPRPAWSGRAAMTSSAAATLDGLRGPGIARRLLRRPPVAIGLVIASSDRGVADRGPDRRAVRARRE